MFYFECVVLFIHITKQSPVKFFSAPKRRKSGVKILKLIKHPMSCFEYRAVTSLSLLSWVGKIRWFQWRSQGLPGWATCPPRGPKWGRKWVKVWGKIRKLNRDLRKNEESGTFTHRDCEAGYGPDDCLNLSSFSCSFFHFSLIFLRFLPHFFLAHPGRPWLRHCLNILFCLFFSQSNHQ